MGYHLTITIQLHFLYLYHQTITLYFLCRVREHHMGYHLTITIPLSFLYNVVLLETNMFNVVWVYSVQCTQFWTHTQCITQVFEIYTRDTTAHSCAIAKQFGATLHLVWRVCSLVLHNGLGTWDAMVDVEIALKWKHSAAGKPFSSSVSLRGI